MVLKFVKYTYIIFNHDLIALMNSTWTLHSTTQRFLVSRVPRWNNACSILPRREVAVPKAETHISYRRIENFSDGVVEGRPFETKDLLFSTYQLDSASRLSSTRFSRMVAYVTHEPDRCTRLLCTFIIDTLPSDSLWCFHVSLP